MQSINRNRLNLISIFILMLGSGLLLAAGISTVSTYRFVTVASRAEGKVIRITPRDVQPVIQFVPVGTTTAVSFVGPVLVNRYTVGDQVPVLYLPDAQYSSGFQTNIDAIDTLWGFQLFLTLWGMSLVFEGLHVKRLAARQS